MVCCTSDLRTPTIFKIHANGGLQDLLNVVAFKVRKLLQMAKIQFLVSGESLLDKHASWCNCLGRAIAGEADLVGG